MLYLLSPNKDNHLLYYMSEWNQNFNTFDKHVPKPECPCMTHWTCVLVLTPKVPKTQVCYHIHVHVIPVSDEVQFRGRAQVPV